MVDVLVVKRGSLLFEHRGWPWPSTWAANLWWHGARRSWCRLPKSVPSALAHGGVCATCPERIRHQVLVTSYSHPQQARTHPASPPSPPNERQPRHAREAIQTRASRDAPDYSEHTPEDKATHCKCHSRGRTRSHHSLQWGRVPSQCRTAIADERRAPPVCPVHHELEMEKQTQNASQREVIRSPLQQIGRQCQCEPLVLFHQPRHRNVKRIQRI